MVSLVGGSGGNEERFFCSAGGNPNRGGKIDGWLLERDRDL